MSPTNIYQVEHVFTPTSPARITFVPRPAATNDRLVNALTTPGKQLVIYGRTGSGKSTLLLNKLNQLYETHIVTNCISGITYDQLLLNAFDQLNSFYETEHLKSKKKNPSRSLELGSLGVKAAAQWGLSEERQTKQQRILPPQLTAQTLARLLGEAGGCWVIEDFHKIDIEQKKRLIQTIKVFVDMSDAYRYSKLIIVSAAETASEVLQYDSELRNRVSEIYVPLMTPNEIEEIIKRGEELLNFSASHEVHESIRRYASGVPSICHQLCLNLCFAADITSTLKVQRNLDMESLDKAIEMYVEDSSATFKSAFNKAFYRRRQTKFNDVQVILEGLLEFGQDGATKHDLFSKIKEKQPDYPRRNLSKQLDQLQDETRGAIIRLDQTGFKYCFADPFHRTYAEAYLAHAAARRLQAENVPAYEKAVVARLLDNEHFPAAVKPEKALDFTSFDYSWANNSIDLYPSIRNTWSQLIKYYFESPRGLSYYLMQLRWQINKMPFIYRELDADLMNDFVSPEIKIVSLDSHATNLRTNPTRITEMIRQTKHLILFGVGKTTFMRYVVLSIIDTKLNRRISGFNILNDNEDIVPFYIPLKCIDNSSPHPILKYLLRTNQLLHQNSGLATLENLASERRVFLLLDGYDEVPFPPSGRNFLKEELSCLGNSNEFRDLEPPLQRLYSSLAACRLWISSRKHFYEIHAPIVNPTGDGWKQSPRAVELCGVGENRVVLIEKIFNKYRRASTASSNLLNEHYFLDIIDKIEEWHHLSYNPLFLTVMSYMYLRTAIEQGDYRVASKLDSNKLILQYVRLLLQDLDEYKVRSLSSAERAAILNGRNNFHEEKCKFLFFFATELLLEDNASFDIDYINEKARYFFSEESDSPLRKEILENLHRTAGGNVVDQLIHSGVFVVVATQDSKSFYDLPHPQFTRALALEGAQYRAEKLREELLTKIKSMTSL